MGLLHGRDERLLDALARLQETREVRAPPQLRDRQLDLARARVPAAGPVAVAVRQPAPPAPARPARRAPHADPRRRPQTNGAVEALHRTIPEECWRPAFARYLQVRFAGLGRDLERYLDYYDFERAHTGRLTHGRIPAEIVYGARKVRAR